MDTSPPPPRGRFLVHPSKRNPKPPPRGLFLSKRIHQDPPLPPPSLPDHPVLLQPIDEKPTPFDDQNVAHQPPDPVLLQPIDEKATPFDDNTLVDLPPPSPDPTPLQPSDEKPSPFDDPTPLQPIDEKPTPSVDVQDTVADPVPPPQPVDEKTTPPDDQITNDLLPKYDAFISFRGTDVRNFFLSHLFAYMNNEKHILTYKDDVNLKRGDIIEPSLIEAIERSSLYVVIFSPNYATSRWCLDELVKILECTKKYGRKMIPVFYGGVTPSHVRNQEASYADAFVEHKAKFPNDEAKLENWKAALKEAADTSGFDSQVTTPESHLVKEVTKRVLEAIRPNSSPITEGLVGIESEIEAVDKLLETDPQRNRVIGFWGMPGIGKTTLASSIFQKIDPDVFEGRHYIPDFAVQSKTKTVKDLQNELFKVLLRDDNPQDIAFGHKLSRLRRLRAFVVIDDVTSASMQSLEELLDGKFCNLFGPGSRMILTSTNQQVLINACQEVHQVPGLDEEKALQLFSFYAFKKDQPPDEYKERCEKVVAYCGGNPLALRVLGVAFYKKKLELWDLTLEKLRTLHKKDIQDLLMISYNELSRDEQSAFLDIACFFNHDDYEFVTRVLDEDFVTNLVDKSLVGINYSKGKIEMHVLLEDLGQDIVEAETDPRKRTRWWEAKDALDLLAENKGTEATEGIWLSLNENEEKIETESSDTFAKMWNLRVLSIELAPESKVVFPNGEGLINTLPRKLTYLRWDLFAATSLPSKFCPDKLRVLRLEK